MYIDAFAGTASDTDTNEKIHVMWWCSRYCLGFGQNKKKQRKRGCEKKSSRL